MSCPGNWAALFFYNNIDKKDILKFYVNFLTLNYFLLKKKFNFADDMQSYTYRIINKQITLYMKKNYLFTLMLLMGFGLNAQVLITGFEFPGGVENLFNANTGLDNNLSYSIRMEDMDGNNDYPLILKKGVDGNGDSAATTSNWENASAYKFLSIKLEAANYGHFTVSSQMRSTNNDPGPADWKVMWRLGDGEWADVPNSEFTIANDWTTGQIIDIPLPEEANNPDIGLDLAWIPTSNLDMNGNEVTAEGTIKIDNIMVYGYENTSIDETSQEVNTRCYPNPSSSVINIAVDDKAVSLTVFDLSGRKIKETLNPQSLNVFNVSNLAKGMYLISVEYPNNKINRLISVK